MELGVVLREVHLRVQHANRLALKYGVSLVRDILADKDGPLHSPAGMTTDEIYKLTLKRTPSSDFYNPHIRANQPLTTSPAPRTMGLKRKQPPPPPNPEHPVRSKVYAKKFFSSHSSYNIKFSLRFLKKSILQYLAGTQELAKVRAKRVLDVSPTSTVSKKGKTDLASETDQEKPTTIVWVWKAVAAADPAKLKKPQPPKKPLRAALFEAVRTGEVGKRDIGIGEDFSHLSTRRQRARLEDIHRDARKLRKARQEINQQNKGKPTVAAGPRKLQVQRTPKKSRQEQDWEDRRLAARKPLTKGKK
ncbi:hypothetical protein C0992_006410 [Termitomyces sp. T32_za158]|nr:hypothetical protein C0992_006410 [Termitomyces sp. T32_za158]